MLILARDGKEGENHANDEDIVKSQRGFEQIAGKILDDGLLVEIVRAVVIFGVGIVDKIDVSAKGDGKAGEGRPHFCRFGSRNNAVLIVDDTKVDPQQKANERKKGEPQPNRLARIDEC